MEKVQKDSDTVILSFGLDNTLGHPDIELQKKQKGSIDKEILMKENKTVIVSMAENCVKAIEIIAQNFPKMRIVYLLPPISESEPIVVEQLRKELKEAWMRREFTSEENSRASYIDVAACLGSIRNLEKPGKLPGHLS